ncbi:MAG: TetR/AcrR family transcriptional regulator [Frankia sp.]|nr:TetR/AcrR family transcriptional regulator [Frankia sp.]
MAATTGRRQGPKRSLLVQERSRDTRRAIVQAALELWAERGYETGVDETTAEEIAARAGVSKATFYLHFARKEDILLATGWLTARAAYDEALRALAANRPIEEIVDELMTGIGRRVEKVPRAALRRVLRAQTLGMFSPRENENGHGDADDDSADRIGFERAFTTVFTHAQQVGTLPETVAPRSLALMLTSLVMGAITDWSLADPALPPRRAGRAAADWPDLAGELRRRARVLLAGARQLPA